MIGLSREWELVGMDGRGAGNERNGKIDIHPVLMVVMEMMYVFMIP